jgi:peptidoglycan/LPS O-acetylase OafA/YrhL
MNKLISIELLRAFAAFTVFYYHSHIGSIAAKYTHIQWLSYTDQIGSTYAVPLFFLLSGFCIHLSSLNQLKENKPLSLKKYYLNRFFRIFPAYFFALILSIIVISFTKPIVKVSSIDFVVHLFIGQGFSVPYFNTINLVLWTITVEMIFYLVYPIYYHINRKLNANIALLFSSIITGISICLYMVFDDKLTPPEIFLFTNLWFGWCFGAWLCNRYFGDPSFFKSAKWAMIIIFIVISFAASLFVYFDNEILINNILNIVIWSPILIFLIQRESYLIKIKKWLKIPIALGVSSYSLYLLHIPLIRVKNSMLLFINNQQVYLIAMVIGTILIPVICYFNYYLIEIPFLKLKKNFDGSKQIKYQL